MKSEAQGFVKADDMSIEELERLLNVLRHWQARQSPAARHATKMRIIEAESVLEMKRIDREIDRETEGRQR